MKKIYILGSGGHAKVVTDIIFKINKSNGIKYKILGYFDDNPKVEEIFGIPVLGKINDLKNIIQEDDNVIIAIGSNHIRKHIYTNYDFNYISIVHPSAIIATRVKIGKGVVIKANVSIGPDSEIGDFTLINTCTSIEENCKIGAYVDIFPNVTIYGDVFINNGARIFPLSILMNNVIIKENEVLEPYKYLTGEK